MLNKIVSFIRKNIKWIVLTGCILVFSLILFEVLTKESFKYDSDVYNFFSTFINDDNTKIVKMITNLGSSFMLILITILVCLFIKDKTIGIFMAINLSLAALLNNLLKLLFRRTRPFILPLVNESSYSFPSGHAMISMAFYGFLIYLIAKYVKNKFLKYLLIIINAIFIILIGSSRIYLGVHYFSDVLAGILMGLIYLIMLVDFIKRKKLKEALGKLIRK